MYYLVNDNDHYSVVGKKEWKKILENNKKAKCVRYENIDSANKALREAIRRMELKADDGTEIKQTKDGLMCFYDSEFNSPDQACDTPSEVVSIGIVVMNSLGIILDRYYSTCAIKSCKEISEHCKEITHLDPDEIKNAKSFPIVCMEITNFLNRYGIQRMYALGSDDRKQFEVTMSLYDKNPYMDTVVNRISNIRGTLKRMLGNDIGNFGLANLKLLCGFKDNVEHNALADAADLANVYYELKTKGYSEEVYQNILKERDERSTYKKTRRITSEDIPAAPADVYAAKEIVTKYLKEMKSSCNPFIM